MISGSVAFPCWSQKVSIVSEWCSVCTFNFQKNRLWNCVKTDTNKCKIKNWKERSRNRTDWEKSI